MIFNKVRLVGATNVDFPLVGADPSGAFVLKSAEGLDPPERDVFLATTIQEGGIRQGTRTRNRVPVFRVGLQPEWTIGQTSRDLRAILYGLLTPKYGHPIIMQLLSGSTVVAQAQGDISRLEASIFSKDPEVQITLMCDGPYFLAPTIQYQTPTKSILSGKTAIDIVNTGTAPAGFWMSLTLQSAQPAELKLSDDSASGQEMTINGPWAAGDTFTIDTRARQRGVWRKPSGGSADESALNRLTGSSPWLQLHGGNNRLLLNNTAFDWVGNAFGHTPAYWGV